MAKLPEDSGWLAYRAGWLEWMVDEKNGRPPCLPAREFCRYGAGEGRAAERSFGQDQLVFAGYPQQVALAGMFDLDCILATQNLIAADAKSFLVGFDGGRSGFFGRVHLVCECKREWIVFYVVENYCQQLAIALFGKLVACCCIATTNALKGIRRVSGGARKVLHCLPFQASERSIQWASSGL
jgi:hypothetical protein